jgi:hypothetical protein
MITDAHKLAEKILSWSDAGVDPFTCGMRLAATDRAIVKEAMRIVRDELIPRIVAQEVDEDFRRRGRYSTDAELSEIARASEAKLRAYQEGGRDRLLQRLRRLIPELAAMSRSDHPDATPDEIELQLRHHLAKMASISR